MPRVHKQKLGARRCNDFCKQNLVRTVEECTSKKLTLCDAAEKYGIPKSTISRHTKSLQQRKPGGCSVIVDYLN